MVAWWIGKERTSLKDRQTFFDYGVEANRILRAMRYLLKLAYRGTDYHGWQRQPRSRTVQQTFEEALQKAFGDRIVLVGCGRTDAGVHAQQYFAHFELNRSWKFDLPERIHRILPADLTVIACRAVPTSFHAQRSAMLRTYTYQFHQQKNPFRESYSVQIPLSELRWEAVQRVIAQLKGPQDFRAFCKRPDAYPHTRCRIERCTFDYEASSGIARFTITANRFLRRMVRLIVGNVLEVGSGRLSEQEFAAHLHQGEPFRYFNAASPEGLFLTEVRYPTEIEVLFADAPDLPLP